MEIQVMKKLYICSLLTLFATTSHAWIHGVVTTKICNNSDYQLHFKKTHSYQADTDNDQSADFTINGGGKCTDITYWMEAHNSNYSYDDCITFTEQSGRGTFDLCISDISRSAQDQDSNVRSYSLTGLTIKNGTSAHAQFNRVFSYQDFSKSWPGNFDINSN